MRGIFNIRKPQDISLYIMTYQHNPNLLLSRIIPFNLDKSLQNIKNMKMSLKF